MVCPNETRARVVTCVVLYTLIADLPGLLLLIGCLIVVWAIIFSFLEVGRIAARSKKTTGPDEAVDPDAPRRVLVEPPTGEPCIHRQAFASQPLSSFQAGRAILVRRCAGPGRRIARRERLFTCLVHFVVGLLIGLSGIRGLALLGLRLIF